MVGARGGKGKKAECKAKKEEKKAREKAEQGINGGGGKEGFGLIYDNLYFS